MTKANLVNAIATQTGYDKATILNIVEAFMYCIKQSIINEEPVFLRGFGTFLVKERKARIGRNICAKTSVQVPAHNIPAFKPSKEFKNELVSNRK